jgi:hypothetical protein
MRERDIEEYLVKRVKAMGGIAYKFTSPQRVNVPDRIVALPGLAVVFVELKAPGVKPNQGQLREHTRLRELGQCVVVIDSLAGVEELLNV